MGGVQFRLGRQDHNKVEDFLAREHGGVSAVIFDGKWHRYQHGAAEAALEAGVDVYFDPATERLVASGIDLPEAPYFTGVPYDVASLVADADARARLVQAVVAAHPDLATAITPPHFYVHDERSASLNVVLAEDTRRAVDKPMRATIVLNRIYGSRTATELAQHYREAGIDQVELRISPLGGDDVSLTIIKSVFAILDAFIAAGLDVTLGLSGNIGHAAVAFGHAQHYSGGAGCWKGSTTPQRSPARALRHDRYLWASTARPSTVRVEQSPGSTCQDQLPPSPEPPPGCCWTTATPG